MKIVSTHFVRAVFVSSSFPKGVQFNNGIVAEVHHCPCVWKLANFEGDSDVFSVRIADISKNKAHSMRAAYSGLRYGDLGGLENLCLFNVIVRGYPLISSKNRISDQDNEGQGCDEPSPMIWRRGYVKWIGLVVLGLALFLIERGFFQIESGLAGKYKIRDIG